MAVAWLAALVLGLCACATGGGLAGAASHADPEEARLVRVTAPAAGAPEARGLPAGLPDDALGRDTAIPPADDPVLELARSVLEARAPAWDPLDREGVARVLARSERERGLPVLLLVALIEQESRFRPQAVGPRGARGLMQIKPFVARDVARRHGLPFEGARTLFDPVANVRLGVRYLAELREEFGTAELALAAYNMGPTRLRRRLERGHDQGPYVRRLLERWTTLRIRFGTTETGIGG